MPSIYLTPGEVDSLCSAIGTANNELDIALKPFRRVNRELMTEEEKQRLASLTRSKAVLTKLQTIVKESE